MTTFAKRSRSDESLNLGGGGEPDKTTNLQELAVMALMVLGLAIAFLVGLGR